MKFLKDQAASLVISKRFKKHQFNNQSFTSAFENAKSFLILMPEDEREFQYAFTILDHLESKKKDFYVLTYDYRVSVLPFKYRNRAISHGIKDKNKIDLPTRRFLSSLKKKNFDAILDLNRKPQLFYIYVCCIVKAEVSIGFKKKFADRVYNLQISSSETNPKISFENLLSCLNML